jgi:phenylalanyl-tRNA synthetase beta chain
MRLTVEWIKEYAPIEAGPEEIADKLTMAGLEVEEKAESALGAVLDIKVTPNRGDCLSVVGVARELAASYRTSMKSLSAESNGAGEAGQYVSIEIDAPDLCPRYAARIVRNLKVGDSPQWMQDRLTAAGMRPINNIVDVTNYVMLETGQPLHAFDYDTLRDHKIIVRRALPGESITTLDGTERALTQGMLVIADAERPVAVAGVMGGAETEMTEQTTTLLLESAHFHPLSVRRAARALDMRTEASYRFERYVDPANVAVAADRACQLISELGMGEVVPGIVDVLAHPAEERQLGVRPGRVSAMLGYKVSWEQVADALQRLGFTAVSASGTTEGPDGWHTLNFRVPSWRPDIVREIDLVEEVGRVLGYEHIPEKLPTGTSTQGGDSEWGRFSERLREILAGAGLQEIVSHSLLAESPLEASQDSTPRIPIRSALSAELSGLRRSLLPGLVDALERNARRGNSPLAFFEIGHVFHNTDNGYAETTSIGGLIAGPVGTGSRQKDSRAAAADFYTGKGIVERVLQGLHINSARFEPTEDPRLHPGRSASIIIGETRVGSVGELHPNLTADLTVRDRLITFSLDFAVLQEAEASRRFVPLTPYPAVVRDLAPRISAEVTYGCIEQAVSGLGLPFLESYALTDVYTGAALPEGTKSLTLSFTFRAPDRTLKDEEVNTALARLRTALETGCGASFVG